MVGKEGWYGGFGWYVIGCIRGHVQRCMRGGKGYERECKWAYKRVYDRAYDRIYEHVCMSLYEWVYEGVYENAYERVYEAGLDHYLLRG